MLKYTISLRTFDINPEKLVLVDKTMRKRKKRLPNIVRRQFIRQYFLQSNLGYNVNIDAEGNVIYLVNDCRMGVVQMTKRPAYSPT